MVDQVGRWTIKCIIRQDAAKPSEIVVQTDAYTVDLGTLVDTNSENSTTGEKVVVTHYWLGSNHPNRLNPKLELSTSTIFSINVSIIYLPPGEKNHDNARNIFNTTISNMFYTPSRSSASDTDGFYHGYGDGIHLHLRTEIRETNDGKHKLYSTQIMFACTLNALKRLEALEKQQFSLNRPMWYLPRM